MLHRFKATNPVWCVAFAFGLTIVLARWVSYVKPGFHYKVDGIHIHYYMLGIDDVDARRAIMTTFGGTRFRG